MPENDFSEIDRQLGLGGTANKPPPYVKKPLTKPRKVFTETQANAYDANTPDTRFIVVDVKDDYDVDGDYDIDDYLAERENSPPPQTSFNRSLDNDFPFNGDGEASDNFDEEDLNRDDLGIEEANLTFFNFIGSYLAMNPDPTPNQNKALAFALGISEDEFETRYIHLLSELLEDDEMTDELRQAIVRKLDAEATAVKASVTPGGKKLQASASASDNIDYFTTRQEALDGGDEDEIASFWESLK